MSPRPAFPVPLCTHTRVHTHTCAHTHVPFPDACPPCTIHPDRLRRAPAALWASRSLQGKEELTKLEAADKRTHGLKRPRPVAQATPSPSSGRMRPKPPPHCAIHPGGTPACIQLSPTTSPRTVGGWALIDNCPGPEGLCPPTPAHSQVSLVDL